MSFQIHLVQERMHRWYCDVERIGTDSKHLTLCSGPNGEGLFLDADDGHQELLLSAADFQISTSEARHAAYQRFAAALTSLGWGTEIHKHGLAESGQPPNR